MDAPSPLGVSWVYLVLLLVPLLLGAAVALSVVRRREIASARVWIVILAAVAAASWTFFTAGAPVRVPIPEDPQGAECVSSDYAPVRWSTDCGGAFAKHLMSSGGPSLVMLVVSVAATAGGMRRRTRGSVPVAPT